MICDHLPKWRKVKILFLIMSMVKENVVDEEIAHRSEQWINRSELP